MEEGIDNKLPFLNVMVEKLDGMYKTNVYRKSTDIGTCMNAAGDCPELYRSSVIKGFLYRAKTLCSDRNDMLLEIKMSQQILINNGYSNSMVNNEIHRFLQKDSNEKRETKGKCIILSQFHELRLPAR